MESLDSEAVAVNVANVICGFQLNCSNVLVRMYLDYLPFQ